MNQFNNESNKCTTSATSQQKKDCFSWCFFCKTQFYSSMLCTITFFKTNPVKLVCVISAGADYCNAVLLYVTTTQEHLIWMSFNKYWNSSTAYFNNILQYIVIEKRCTSIRVRRISMTFHHASRSYSWIHCRSAIQVYSISMQFCNTTRFNAACTTCTSILYYFNAVL